MEEIVNLVESSSLSQYHDTTLKVLNLLSQQHITSYHFTDLLQKFLSSQSQSKIIYFYILEQLLLHNSDNIKRNKLSILLNLALANNLNYQTNQPHEMMNGLLLINIHINNITKSGVWIPEVWRFMGRCLQTMETVQVKKYRQKDWGILFVLDKISHKDLLYVFIKLLVTLFSNKNLSILSDRHKHLILRLKQKTQQPLLTHIIESFNRVLSSEHSQIDTTTPYMIKQYTPRILATERTDKQNLNLLKKKRNQLKKRVISDLRGRIYDRMQEKQIKDEAKMERIRRRQKKELFIIEKQTAEAKKLNRMKKITKAKGKTGKK